ncbi:MAG: hypothetical protein P8M25_01780 [Paracoccaceae bacterium]|nr:hypothetical protein [Paracoccaceae bacterium]
MTIEIFHSIDWEKFKSSHLPYGNRALLTKDGTPQTEIDAARLALAKFLMRKLKSMSGVDTEEGEILCACFARMLPDERLAAHLLNAKTYVDSASFSETTAFEDLAMEALTLTFQLNAVFSSGLKE